MDGPSIWKAASRLSSQDQSSHSRLTSPSHTAPSLVTTVDLTPAPNRHHVLQEKYLLAQSLIKLKSWAPRAVLSLSYTRGKLQGWADLRVWRPPLLR